MIYYLVLRKYNMFLIFKGYLGDGILVFKCGDYRFVKGGECWDKSLFV